MGIAGVGSGCCDAAREDTSFPLTARLGVVVRGGIGLGAFAFPPIPTAGDFWTPQISKVTIESH